MALPPFHTFGSSFQLYAPIAYLVTAVVYPPSTENDPYAQPVIATSDNIIECLKKVPSNALMTVPTLLEPMAESEDAIETLKKLGSVVRTISFNLPTLWLTISSSLAVAHYQSRSAINFQQLGYISSAGTGELNSGSWWQLATSNISATTIGCGCVSLMNRNLDGYHKEMRHTSCKSWYEIVRASIVSEGANKLE